MSRFESFLLSVLFIFVAQCANAGTMLYQYSTIDSLLAGVYDGDLTVSELLRHGDLGLGTFNHLDGEMVILDGSAYKVTAQGTVLKMEGTARTPFAVTTSFKADASVALTHVGSLKQLEAALKEHLDSDNLPHAFRMKAKFPRITTRSVPRQKAPYPKLVDVVKHQSVFQFTEIEGTLLGFYCPRAMRGENVHGFHFHFLSSDLSKGGHVLDVSIDTGDMGIDTLGSLQVEFPRTEAFMDWQDVPAAKEELEKVEKGDK